MCTRHSYKGNVENVAQYIGIHSLSIHLCRLYRSVGRMKPALGGSFRTRTRPPPARREGRSSRPHPAKISGQEGGRGRPGGDYGNCLVQAYGNASRLRGRRRIGGRQVGRAAPSGARRLATAHLYSVLLDAHVTKDVIHESAGPMTNS